MVIIVKTDDEEAAFASFASNGVEVKGINETNREARISRCLTPSFICPDGNYIFSIDMLDSDISKIPNDSPPTVEIVWREDSGEDEPEWEMSYDPPVFETPLDENGDPLPEVEVKYKRKVWRIK